MRLRLALGLCTAALALNNCGESGSKSSSTGAGAGGMAGAAAAAGAAAGGTANGAEAGMEPGGGSSAEPQGGAGPAGAPSDAGAAGVVEQGGGANDEGVVALAQNAPTGIAVDAKNVYWANSADGTIVSCPLAGCAGEEPDVVIADAGEARGIAVDATSVYWMSAPNQANMASIKTCPLIGCVGQPVVLGDVSSMRPNDVHVLGTRLYYTAWPDFSFCTTTDCAPASRTLLGNMPVVSVDVDATHIYFSRYGNSIISRCDRDDCTGNMTDLVTGHTAISVAVDATTLYFSQLAYFAIHAVPNPGIFACPIEGCGDAEPRAVVPGVSAFAIALSPTRLFYTDVESGAVASVAK